MVAGILASCMNVEVIRERSILKISQHHEKRLRGARGEGLLKDLARRMRGLS